VPVAVQRIDLNPLHLGSKLAGKALGAIRQLAASAGNTAKSLGTAALTTVRLSGTGLWNTARTAAGALGNKVGSLGSEAWKTAKSLGGAAWNTARSMGSAAWSAAQSVGSAAWRTAKSLGGKAWSTAKGLGSAAWRGVTSLGGQAWSALTGFAGTALGGLKGFTQGVRGKAASLAHGLSGLAKRALSGLSLKSLCKNLDRVLGRITAGITGAVKNARQLGTALWKRASGIGRAAAAAAARWAGKVKRFATHTLRSALSAVGGAARAAWTSAKALGERALGGARRAAAAGWEAAKRLGSRATSGARALGTAMLGTVQRVGTAITGTAQRSGRALLGLASRLSGVAAAKVTRLANAILSKARSLVGPLADMAKSLVAKAVSTAKSLAARALDTARSLASRAWQTARHGAATALGAAKSLGARALATATSLAGRAWTTARQLGAKATATAARWMGRAFSIAKQWGGKATGAIRDMAGTVWKGVRNAGGKAWGLAKRAGSAALLLAKKAASGAVGLVTRAAATAAQGIKGIAGAARKLCGLLTRFGPFLAGIKKLIANPDIILNAIHDIAAPLVEKIPGATRSAFSRLAGETVPDPGTTTQRPAVQRRVVQRQAAPGQPGTVPAPKPNENMWQGIWRHLGVMLVYLRDNWWAVFKEAGKQLIFPLDGIEAEYGDLKKQLSKAWAALTSLHYSTLIDAALAAEGTFVGMISRFTGWFTIACVLVGAVGGLAGGAAFGGGVGGIPGLIAGAGAGLEVANAVGDGLDAADMALQATTLAKAFYNLKIQHDTGQQREEDYSHVASSGLGIGMELAMMAIGAIAVRFAKVALRRIRKIKPNAPTPKSPTPRPHIPERPKTQTPETPTPRHQPHAPKDGPTRPEPTTGHQTPSHRDRPTQHPDGDSPRPADPELSAALGDLRSRIDVTVDPHLPGRTVRVHYNLTPDGLITNVRMRAGPSATPRDIELHLPTARTMLRYSGLAGRVQQLLHQLQRWIGIRGPPPVGTRAWEAQIELKKFPGIIADRTHAYTNADLATRANLEIELNSLHAQVETHALTLKEMNLDLGHGFVAAEGVPPGSSFGIPEDHGQQQVPLSHESIEAATSKIEVGEGDARKFKDHFIRHKRLLELALGTAYPKLKTDGPRFRADIQENIRNGQFRFEGLGTLKKGEPEGMIYRGMGLTIVLRETGDFWTLLKSGEGLDASIRITRKRE
jgi:hypothetical protein